MTTGSVVVGEVCDGVAHAVLSNPDKRNALTPEMLHRIGTLLDELERDDDVRVLVVAGDGPYFSSGYALDRSRAGGGTSYGEDVAEACERLQRSPITVVAKVRGYAIGAGLDLACACDFRIAEAGAVFAVPAVKLGLVYPWRGIMRITRLTGDGLARRLFLAGDKVPAADAVATGLVTRVVSVDELDAATDAFAAELAGRSRFAMAGTKSVLFELRSAAPVGADVADRFDAMTRESMDGDEFHRASRAVTGGRGR